MIEQANRYTKRKSVARKLIGLREVLGRREPSGAVLDALAPDLEGVGFIATAAADVISGT